MKATIHFVSAAVNTFATMGHIRLMPYLGNSKFTPHSRFNWSVMALLMELTGACFCSPSCVTKLRIPFVYE